MSNLTLSITTIGDLLLEQKITNGDTPIEGISLKVPVYQRPYKWTARNAIQLFEDILEALNQNKERYRVGTLILHRDDEHPGQYDIVDGLQRTITFALLLKALGETKDLAFLNEELNDNEHNRHNVANNFRALSRRVGKSDGDSLEARTRKQEQERLRDYVEQQCELVVVITDDVSEAFQFFDSQNARGRALYPHDLLKAYHLREMNDESEELTERTVREWEQVSQTDLAEFFGCYLYRIKEWVNGNRAGVLNEQNLQMFKGVTRSDRTPYAQFFKGAYSYADMVNASAMPFVSGTRNINAFQLNTPIIAGRPFFEYTKHYYAILKDIRDNSKYEGFYINDNPMVKTLDRYFRYGTGNGIARLLFDTSVLLYVDRFCPETFPTKEDMALFDQFTVFAFVWAYSLRAQYTNLGWLSAQNYIMAESRGDKSMKNAFNMYKLIARHDSPVALLSTLADMLTPLTRSDIRDNREAKAIEKGGLSDEDGGIFQNYLYFFQEKDFLKI